METRRSFLYGSGGAAAAIAVAACRGSGPPASPTGASSGQGLQPIEVAAVEDLMREHGVLRRCVVVYREAAARLRAGGPTAIPPDALRKTAQLFRAFGEDYHEKRLEEEHVFLALKRARSLADGYVEALALQHQRGRSITDYITSVAGATAITASAEPLAEALEAFARMYETHTAREDTVVFPAWKKTMSPKDYETVGDRFEEIEQQQFGKDGFESAVQQIAAIEERLGIGSLAAFMAPAPPKL